MLNRQIIEMRKLLATTLPPTRYEHSVNVSFVAVALAICHDIDASKAELAGILHDCAKCYDDRQLMMLCAEHGIALTEDEQKAPVVIHAKYGVWMAEHEYGITDPDVLAAIRWHATGKADMSKLEMILYIADYIEPLRDKASNLSRMRQLAFVDLEQTMHEVLGSSLAYLQKKGSHIDVMTQVAYEYYEKLCNYRETKQKDIFLKGDADAIK